jgi:hypothetical protein
LGLGHRFDSASIEAAPKLKSYKITRNLFTASPKFVCKIFEKKNKGIYAAGENTLIKKLK